MRKLTITITLIGVIALTPFLSNAETIDVLIKGVDDGVKHSKQQDYKEAVMNAKLEAIERAGVEIESITKVVNFEMKFKAVESKAKAVLLPGFQLLDMGYQTDGTYQVVLSGKVQAGGDEVSRKIDSDPILQKVLEQLVTYMADDSLEASKKIKAALDMLPDDFSYKSHKLTRQAKRRLNSEALWPAINKCDIDTIKKILDGGVDDSSKTIMVLNAVTFCKNQKDLVKTLLDNGADVDGGNLGNNWTALIYATANGLNKDIVELLIKYNANINVREDLNGFTPLMWAAIKDRKDLVKTLLNNGADVNIKDDEGKTALVIAREKGHLETLELLKQYGAKY